MQSFIKPNTNNNFMQGNYIPKNPRKYVGDVNKIRFRSSYERIFMGWLDNEFSILEWSSEVTFVPYFDPVKKTKRKYVVDFTVKAYHTNGDIIISLVEVKPYKQTFLPKKGTKSDKSFNAEFNVWQTNSAKWAAAEAYCKEKGWRWCIITERELLPGTIPMPKKKKGLPKR